MNTNYAHAIETHYASQWSARPEHVPWDKGPVAALPVPFRVLRFPRSTHMDAYATVCMSQPADSERVELHLLTAARDRSSPELAELLTAIAHYHRTSTSLGLGHTVNFGRPWLAGSACSYGLLSLPYLDGPGLEWLSEPRVRFLWLIPVTEAEVRFKQEQGLEALERRFDESRFDYLDPGRRSVV